MELDYPEKWLEGWQSKSLSGLLGTFLMIHENPGASLFLSRSYP